MRAPFIGGWEVLALGAVGASLVVLAEAGAATGPATIALPAVLAEAGATAGPAMIALPAVLANAGAATGLALTA